MHRIIIDGLLGLTGKVKSMYGKVIFIREKGQEAGTTERGWASYSYHRHLGQGVGMSAL